MVNNPKRMVVFPGRFDPITNGHLDVIRRAAELFDELVIAVGDNPDKRAMLPLNLRAEIIVQAVASLPNVRVEAYTGLTVDLVRRLGAQGILRGIRNSSDLQSELQMAQTNRAAAGVETMFIMTSPEHSFISSSLIRQIAQMGGDVSALVPAQVLPHIRAGGEPGAGRAPKGP
ncbi:MAG TPA: pantetheine-phosphate adenylyltransferase [Phycisphaerae bacterium]|nr:pantetheine-phosphate adenylyltransferase [Phycisphaerae bacterium]